MDFNEGIPIFQQLARQIEEGILSGAYPEEGQIPSITDFSVTLRINPATALKGINLLVDKGLVYKKRGVGMFVSTGAQEKIKQTRQEQFYCEYVERLVKEASRLGIDQNQLSQMIERGFKDVH